MDVNVPVLVTGGANGIGKAIAKEFAVNNYTVIIADKDEKQGNELAERFSAIQYEKLDFSDLGAIPKLFAKLDKKGVMPKVLVNNVGISRHKPFLEMSLNEWQEIINVNLSAAFTCAQAFVKYNKESGFGRIINIASTRQQMSEPGWEAYAASKGGLHALTHALAASLGGTGITVNSISPGWIQTENYDQLSGQAHQQHFSGRVGKPDDISSLCLFLANRKNDFMNGENIVVDGGMTRKMIYNA